MDYIAQSESTLQDGYNKLTAYKTPDNGYEWFGNSPASEPLTAYGILQFTDMAQATNGIVD